MTTIDYSAQITSANPTDIPLIFTTLGNIPVAALEYKTEWINDPKYIMFIEKWYLGEELVKSNSHAYAHNPFDGIGAEQTTF